MNSTLSDVTKCYNVDSLTSQSEISVTTTEEKNIMKIRKSWV